MLTLYSPLSHLLRDEFFGDRAFQAFQPWEQGFASLARAANPGAHFNPAVDIVEQHDAYLVKAELPGVAPENIDVQVEDGVLTVRGERKHESEQSRGGYRRVERSYGTFSRSFVLPKGTNAEAIAAQVDSGVLTISIPKPAPTSARKVEVKRTESLVDKAKKLFAKTPDDSTPNPQA
jgi:HSP20 family protein